MNESSLDGIAWNVAPTGRLDANTVADFESALRERIQAGETNLVVDMNDVSYISSSGLRALLTARRMAMSHGGDLKLCRLPPRIYKIFEMVGFTQVFGIYDSVESALSEFM